MRVLLVEGDADLAIWLAQALMGRGFQVDRAEDRRMAELRIT